MNMRVFLCVSLTNSEVPCAVYKKHIADCFQRFLSSAPFSLTLSQCFLLFSISLSLINLGCTGRCLSARVHKGALVLCCPDFTSWLFCTKSKQVFPTFPQQCGKNLFLFLVFSAGPATPCEHCLSLVFCCSQINNALYYSFCCSLHPQDTQWVHWVLLIILYLLSSDDCETWSFSLI